MKTRHLLAALALVALPAISNATVIYDDFTGGGNYKVTVNQGAGVFNVEVTVNPWNAEVLGLFIDWGTLSLTNSTVTGSNVSLYAKDTSSLDCGAGCNLNGSLSNAPNDGWEWVLRLGNQGFDGIQTFNFSLADNGLDESVWGLVGIRSQQYCSSGTLPTGSCGGSEKVFGSPTRDEQPVPVPEPGTLGLLGLGLAAAAAIRRRTSRA